MAENSNRFYLMRGEHFLFLRSLDETDSSTFSYSVPINYGNQVPLLLKVGGGFESYKIIKDKGEFNKKIQFRLPAMKKDEKIKIHFEYWVLAKRLNKKNFSNINIPLSGKEMPENVKEWLSPTKSIQSNNFLIKFTARLLKGSKNGLSRFIKKVMIWNAFRRSSFTFLKTFIVKHQILNKIFIPDSYWINLEDAVSSLLFGGLCTGQANLAAALLRSMEIPARVLISTSTFYGENYWLDAQHYFNEFYCPGIGWVPSQSGKLFLTQGENMILRILYPEDENIAGNGIGGYGGMAPWFWIENKNIVFDKPDGYMSYKLPESKKIGVPAVRGWMEQKIEVPMEFSEKILEATRDIWQLFIRNVDKNDDYFSKAFSLQEQSISLLKQLRFEEYFNALEEIKHLYKKL